MASSVLSSLIVSEEDSLIDIKLHYIAKKHDKGGLKLKVLSVEEGEKLIEEGDEDVQVLNTKWKIGNWQEQNIIASECNRINPMSGQSEFDFFRYRDIRVKRCLISWDLKFNDEVLPVTEEYIDRLPAQIVAALFDRYEKSDGFSEEDQGK